MQPVFVKLAPATVLCCGNAFQPIKERAVDVRHGNNSSEDTQPNLVKLAPAI